MGFKLGNDNVFAVLLGDGIWGVLCCPGGVEVPPRRITFSYE